MADQSEIELEGAKFHYMSPAQELLDEAIGTLCSICPLARWYKREGWHCFCSEFKTFMYDEKAGNVAPVRVCDGRELEVARLTEEVSRG